MKLIIAIALGIGLSSTAFAQDITVELVKLDTQERVYTESRTLTEKESTMVRKQIERTGRHGTEGACGQLISATLQKYKGSRYVGDVRWSKEYRLKLRFADMIQGIVAHCTSDDNNGGIPDVNACDNNTPHDDCGSHGQSWSSANCTFEDLDTYDCGDGN